MTEWPAASMGCSSRVPDWREAIRAGIVFFEIAADLEGRGLQAHSPTCGSLSMGSRSGAIPEWPSPLVRTALEMEVGLLFSEVQEILAAE